MIIAANYWISNHTHPKALTHTEQKTENQNMKGSWFLLCKLNFHKVKLEK